MYLFRHILCIELCSNEKVSFFLRFKTRLPSSPDTPVSELLLLLGSAVHLTHYYLLIQVGCRLKAKCPLVEPGPIGGVPSVGGISKGS